MDNSRKIGDINGNIDSNVAIQSESVTQTQTNLRDDNQVHKALDEIFDYIITIEDDIQKAQAEFNAEILKEAVDKKDIDKGKKVLGFLRNSIGTTAAITTIAKFFGLNS
ncbi:hypothetical protein [Bacillus velezensis]|uniref:hypothetical protein n=1 Tax=Bacillus velezensis TaxID=492670 RepID=UPI00295F3001|nr:hypothetical protein [Bacillus velezensis]MDW0355035.1 hypothetical protein [Bacillus velezensis]MEE1863441.1 hypothetical protein [Bacillus velezensis]